MKPTATEVLHAALQLMADERLDLVDVLSASLPDNDDEHRRKWSEECRRRMAETDAGVPGVPLEEVLKHTRELLESLKASARG